VFTKVTGVPDHGGLDGQHVFAQGFGGCVFKDDVPGFISGHGVEDNRGRKL
jgi:hypothetical protein